MWVEYPILIFYLLKITCIFFSDVTYRVIGGMFVFNALVPAMTSPLLYEPMLKIDHVLFVDDDEITNYLNVRLVQKLKIANEIKVATNGLEALELIKKKRKAGENCPNLIFLDLNMPLMDGFQFLETFSQMDECAVPPRIVVVTTSTNNKDLDRLQHYSFISGYINKPMTTEKLQRVLGEVYAGK